MKLSEFSQFSQAWLNLDRAAVGTQFSSHTQTPHLEGDGSSFGLPLGPLLLVLWFSGLTPVSPASRDSPLH